MVVAALALCLAAAVPIPGADPTGVRDSSAALNAQNVSDLLFAFSALGGEGGVLESVRRSSAVKTLGTAYARLRGKMQPGYAADGLEGLSILGLEHLCHAA